MLTILLRALDNAKKKKKKSFNIERPDINIFFLLGKVKREREGKRAVCLLRNPRET